MIDNIFCPVELHDSYKSYILIDDISNHMPCLSILSDVFPSKMSAETITRCRLTEKAITKMKDHLESLDWSSLVPSNINCETNYGTVHNILQETLDEYAPVRTVKVKRKKLSQPWLTKGLINCQRKQKLLYKERSNYMTKTLPQIMSSVTSGTDQFCKNVNALQNSSIIETNVRN